MGAGVAPTLLHGVKRDPSAARLACAGAASLRQRVLWPPRPPLPAGGGNWRWAAAHAGGHPEAGGRRRSAARLLCSHAAPPVLSEPGGSAIARQATARNGCLRICASAGRCSGWPPVAAPPVAAAPGAPSAHWGPASPARLRRMAPTTGRNSETFGGPSCISLAGSRGIAALRRRLSQPAWAAAAGWRRGRAGPPAGSRASAAWRGLSGSRIGPWPVEIGGQKWCVSWLQAKGYFLLPPHPTSFQTSPTAGGAKESAAGRHHLHPAPPSSHWPAHLATRKSPLQAASSASCCVLH
jgi:hypothetical protein